MPRDLSERIARARAVPIADEIYRRRMSLRRVGLELVGACPVCGDGGKGSRSNRFAVHLRKNVWLCRQCNAGGGVVDLVMHLDGIGFKEAVASLAAGVLLPLSHRPESVGRMESFFRIQRFIRGREVSVSPREAEPSDLE